MKSIFSLRTAKRTRNIFSCTASCRAGLLVIACLLLPRCIYNTDNSNSAIALPAISVNNTTGRILLLLQHPLDIIFINAPSVNAAGEKATPANNIDNTTTSNEQKTNPVQHFPDSSPAIADEQQIDMHDEQAEEDALHIACSRLLRILIMVAFVVMIV